MTDLEKSHSATSNFKLTLLSIIASISSSILWISLFLLASEKIQLEIAIIILSLSGIISLLCLILFNMFKR